jgi:hypothetical protein
MLAFALVMVSAKEAMVSVRLAHPVRRVVHPASLINRETRIRAERESAPSLCAGRHLADYPVRRDASLNPSDKRSQRIEIVRSGPACAMMHSGNHEQPGVVLQMLETAAQRLSDGAVVVNAHKGRERRIAPPVVHNQFAAVGEER